MGDISALLANAAQTNADFDLNKINKSYWEGRDQAAKNDLRDAFKDGVPLTPDGQPDFASMAKTLYQKGGFDQGTAAANLGLQRQQLQMGQDAAARIGQLEGGGGQPQAPIVSPPSINRSGTATVAPPLNKGGTTPQDGNGPQGGGTLMQVLSSAGIPNDQLQTAAASVARQLGLDNPNAPIDLQDPQVRNVLVPAIQQLKRMGIGQVALEGQPAPPPQAIPQQPQAAPQPNPQQNQGTFGAPVATPTRGAVPTGPDPEIQKQIATYTYIASNPAYPKSVQEAALARLKALQGNIEPTGPMKEYDLYRRQGGNLPFNEFLAEGEAKKTAATEEAKTGATRYASIVDTGTKAQQEIPQLQMLQTQMNDPNFFSGAGEKYNLLYKRLKSAVGIDPDAAVPQEMLRKVMASNVLGSLGGLKGLGQIRNAEIKMAQTASAAPDNSIPANKLLVEIALRTHERNAEIADKAQNYKEQNGSLDAGFDKQVTAYYKQHPLFSDAEIKDFHKAIGESAKPAATGGAVPKFSSPNDVHAAVASGQLKKGDTFQDSTGKTRYVP